MKEKIGLLSHHAEKMRRLYEKHSSKGDLHSLALFHSFGLVFSRAPDGTDAYPAVWNKEAKDKLVDTLERSYLAIEENQIYEISERGTGGQKNLT